MDHLRRRLGRSASATRRARVSRYAGEMNQGRLTDIGATDRQRLSLSTGAQHIRAARNVRHYSYLTLQTRQRGELIPWEPHAGSRPA
jgi:hypothetical protein